MKGEWIHSRWLLGWIILSLFTFHFSILHAHEATADSASIYQGMTIKLDLGATALALIQTRAQMQHYELGMNWRLINRLYPTFEAGYAGSLSATAANPERGELMQGDSLHYRGQGGFFRVGLDINPLKKSAAQSLHALLVGVRFGTAIQGYDQTILRTTTTANTDMGITTATDFTANARGVRADCWGEVVAGCQVDVYRGLTMGWMARMRFLFTRAQPADTRAMLATPVFIPGFGRRDNMVWGLSYYIGYRF